MSVKSGLRRLLIALSGFYWAMAIVTALALGFHQQGLCVDEAAKAISNDTLYRTEFAACQPVTLFIAGLLLVYAAVGFAILAAAYFTMRWVVRGFVARA